jgi:hypothetical protein
MLMELYVWVGCGNEFVAMLAFCPIPPSIVFFTRLANKKSVVFPIEAQDINIGH